MTRSRSARLERKTRETQIALATRAPDARQSQIHRCAVAGEAFQLGEPDHLEAELAQLRRLEAHKAHPLHEILHAEGREEARRASGREHVVGTRKVVAH